jgi:hypothetical protein
VFGHERLGQTEQRDECVYRLLTTGEQVEELPRSERDTVSGTGTFSF